jgi:hypothetical protein
MTVQTVNKEDKMQKGESESGNRAYVIREGVEHAEAGGVRDHGDPDG